MGYLRKIYCLVLTVAVFAAFGVETNPYIVDMPRQGFEAGGVWLQMPVRSRPADLHSSAEYLITVENTNSHPVDVRLIVEASSKNMTRAQLSADKLSVASGGSETAVLNVSMSERIPVGSYETAQVRLDVDGVITLPLQISTVHYRPHPYTLATDAQIQQAKDKIEKYDWAKKSYEHLIAEADKNVFKGLNYPVMERKGFKWKGLITGNAEAFWPVALAYKLTGNQRYKQTVIDYLRAVADPQAGYPLTAWATHSTAYVHEGEFFTFYSAIYDTLYNEPELTEDDHKNIQAALRLYLETCKHWHYDGDIGNWLTTANAAAIITSLVLQDIESYEYFINCKHGFDEQLSYGIMADGWWLEGAGNYSYLVATFYGYAAVVCDNWGFNLFDRRVPARYQSNEGRSWKNGWMSMNFDIWGPSGKSYRTLKDLYDGAIILMDENGYVVANNDSDKKKPGTVFELGYAYFKEPAYAWCISNDERMDWQSLIYGAGELPVIEDPRSVSGYAANVGITALRSQNADAGKGEQIEAYLKWGSHGGWHGHFDRTNLLGLRRFEKDLFSPKPSWFGYSSPLYKAWVEPSISHNLVIVDQFQQEPVESSQLLFYSSSDLQVSCVETKARWQEKLPWDINDPGDLDSGNMAKMVDYGDNEPVLQRRLMAVTDHYVVVADYLEGEREHTFDWLLHPAGFIETIGKVSPTGYREKLKDDVNSSYYYITNCDTFAAQGHIINRFKDENLNLDVHTFLTEPAEMVIGTFPFNLCRQPVKVLIDGREVLSDVVNVHSCSLYPLEIDVSGGKTIEIRLPRRTHSAKDKPGDYMAIAEPHIVAAGKTIPLSELDYTIEGAKKADYGRDYDGNVIDVAGKHYQNAVMIEAEKAETVIRINLNDTATDKFVAYIGADHIDRWNDHERKTLQFRSKGKSFKRISILEPYQGSPQIKSARLLANDTLSIELQNGLVQEMRINEIASRPTDDISVSFAQLKDGNIISTQKAENSHKRLIYKDDFDQSLDNWRIEQMPGGTVQIRNGVLEIDDAAGCTVWFKHKLEGAVSIEYDVEIVVEGGPNDRVSDLNCFWMAQDPANPDDIFAQSAQRGGSFGNYNSLRLYYVGYAANENTTTRFRRYAGDGSKPLLPGHDLDLYKMTGGEKLHIKIVSNGAINQYWVNGKKIFDFKDPQPYTEGFFGFRTVKNRMRIDNFRVYNISGNN